MKTLLTINLNQLRRILLPLILLFNIHSFSQSKLDSLLSKINPEKFSAAIEKKVNKLEDKIIAKSEKTLSRLQKQEEKIYKKQLGTKDSLIAKARLAEIQTKYKEVEDRLKNPTTVTPNN